MKKLIFLLLGALMLTYALRAEKISYDGWTLTWEDEFDGPALDTSVWRKCVRATPDWANTMSEDSTLYVFRDGTLVLRGVQNTDTDSDPSPWLTGGIFTRGKKAFAPGRFEVRARLHAARGAWPAIWLMPFHKVTWPAGGEIDIMERLNYDSKVHQSVHSPYTLHDKNTTDPKSTLTSPIDTAGWNIYGVDILPDKLVFHINGEVTLEYPRIEGDTADRQFPFYREQYLLIDMQLGGKWVGDVDPADLPVEMEVDWARHYSPIKTH